MTAKRDVMFHPGRIMVPTDFSVSSEAAIAAATDLARQFGAQLHLLHVVPALPVQPYDAYFPEEQFVLELKDSAEKRLSGTVARLEKCGVRASFGLEIGNDVVGNILHVLEDEKIDLLVLSTHGMSDWRPLVFGSIAEKVMKLAKCTVLLLRTPKGERQLEAVEREPAEAQEAVIA